MEFRQALPIGSVLVDDYRLTAVLGQGGFGLTYKADDLRLGAPVAVKEYFPGDLALREPGRSTVIARSARDEDVLAWGRRKFLDEARTLARFRHPNIVRVNRLFEANNTAYMVLDFELGPSLSEWRAALGRGPSQREIDRIAVKLLDAVETVHAGGILHRDIKPANIIMRDGSEPVLIDFGAARQALSAQSRTVHAIVTPGYSPKEQYAVDLDRQGTWSDIYALGATLYFIVTGKAPPDALSRELAEPMPMAAGGAGPLRPGFLAAIDAAMNVRADKRPQSVATWRAMLLGDPQASPGHSPVTPATTGASPQTTAGILAVAPLEEAAGKAAPGSAVRRVTFEDIPAGSAVAPPAAAGRSTMPVLAASVIAGLLALGGLWYWIAILAPQRDDAAWERARSADSISAYERYLAEQPSGRHIALARERRQELAQPRPAEPTVVVPRARASASTGPDRAKVPANRPEAPKPAAEVAATSDDVSSTSPTGAGTAATTRAPTAPSLPARRTVPEAVPDAETAALAQAASPATWRLAIGAFSGPPVTGFTDQQTDFKTELNRLSGGKLDFAVLAGSDAIPANLVLGRVRDEAGLMAWHSPAFSWRRREFAIFAGSLPFGLPPGDFVRWMRAEGAHLLEQAYAANGLPVRAIPCGIAGNVGAWFRREIKSPADFKDLRAFAPPLMGDVLRKLGATIVDLPSSAVIRANLERLDAAFWMTPLTGIFALTSPPFPVFHSPGVHSPAYMMELVIGAGTWTQMSEPQRRLVDDACRRNIDRWSVLFPASQNSVLARIRARPVTISPFAAPVREALEKATGEVIAEEAAKNPRFKEAIESHNRFRR